MTNGPGQSTSSNYIDLLVEVHLRSKRRIDVAAQSSLGREARSEMRFPYDDRTLENRLLHLENAILRSGERRRRARLPRDG
jgi:hypothetical protein